MATKYLSWLSYGFKTFILKKELPYLFGMVITDKCNLNCFYCEGKNSGRYHFSYDNAKATLENAYQRGHRSLYKALRNNNWKRPIPQIELGTKDRIFTCCRDVDNPSVCENCGYANCVEVSQILALKPSAMWQIIKMVYQSHG